MSGNSHNAAPECWRLDGTGAELIAGSFGARIDLERPSHGLRNVRIKGSSCGWQLLQIGLVAAGKTVIPDDAPWQPADIYVRGCDLVASYREPLGQPFNVQLYWRIIEGGAEEMLVVEIIVSVQTPLWEAYPCVTIGSEVHGGEIVEVDDLLVFSPAGNWSYVELPYPGDFALPQANPAASGASGLRWRFGPQFMERGVIRRLRLRGAIAPRDHAFTAAKQLRLSLLEEPPPLTA
jgi:hypothetical protein